GVHADLQVCLPAVSRASAYVHAGPPAVATVRVPGEVHRRAQPAQLPREDRADLPGQRRLRVPVIGRRAGRVARLGETTRRYGTVDLVRETGVAELVAGVDHDAFAPQWLVCGLGRRRLGRR